MRQGITTKGFWIVIGIALSLTAGIILLGQQVGWFGGIDLNALFVDPINALIPGWMPIEIPDLFG